MNKVLGVFVVGLILLPLTLLAEDPPSTSSPATGCSTKLIHLTDPELAKRLPNMTVLSSGPIMVEHRASGETTTKISRKEFVTLDEQGNIAIIAAKCTLTCTGTGCLQDGCEPDSFNGCTGWNCGLTCIGTCTQSSQLLK